MDWNNYKLELVEGKSKPGPLPFGRLGWGSHSKFYEMRFYVNGILRYYHDQIPGSWVKEREDVLFFIGSEFPGGLRRDAISGTGAEYRNCILNTSKRRYSFKIYAPLLHFQVRDFKEIANPISFE